MVKSSYWIDRLYNIFVFLRLFEVIENGRREHKISEEHLES